MERLIRPESHEIDTQARRKVPLLFPPSWEHREMTGRDYGIDMIIEVFQKGYPTGNSLALQIKGTSKLLEGSNTLYFDVPVQTLIYSELFIAPVLLVVCSIHENVLYYVWLQEYIKVVLNHNKPRWRQNKKTVRVSIPIQNKMPADKDKLLFISNYPKRLFEWCQFSRICEEIHYTYNEFYMTETMIHEYVDESESIFAELIQSRNNCLKKIIRYLDEIVKLRSIFGVESWNSTQSVLKNFILPAKKAANELLTTVKGTNGDISRDIHKITQISSLLSIHCDSDYSNTLWTITGNHDF